MCPWSAFLFSGSVSPVWVFWVSHNTCQRLLWSHEPWSRPTIIPFDPKTQFPWLCRQTVLFRIFAAWAKRNVAIHVIVVWSQVRSGTPRFRHPWQSNPKSCHFRLRSAEEIRVRSQCVAVGGLLWACVGTILRTPSDIPTFQSEVLPMVLRETSGTKMQRSARVILRSWRMICSTIATLSSEIDDLPLLSSTWISVRPAGNSLHHLRTFLTSMHDSPYTSVNWRWISIGLTPFAFKNRITARTSHLAGAASGSSITNGCRAKTERPSRLSDGLFGSRGTNKRSGVANSHSNSFPAAPELWRPYFWDHPSMYINAIFITGLDRHITTLKSLHKH